MNRRFSANNVGTLALSLGGDSWQVGLSNYRCSPVEWGSSLRAPVHFSNSRISGLHIGLGLDRLRPTRRWSSNTIIQADGNIGVIFLSLSWSQCWQYLLSWWSIEFRKQPLLVSSCCHFQRVFHSSGQRMGRVLLSLSRWRELSWNDTRLLPGMLISWPLRLLAIQGDHNLDICH